MKRNQRRRARRHPLALCALLLAALALGGWLLGSGIRTMWRHSRHIYTIAIDAGHGGTDTGANGILRECDMTAQTAQTLYTMLENDPHFIPYAIHTDPAISATPAQRARIADRAHADLLLSIHGNAAGPDAQGFECYPVTPGRRQHKKSMRFAKLLVSGMSDAGAVIRGQNGIRYAYYVDGQKTLVDSSDDSVHSEETFTLLERANCPAVLVEQCFVTNQADVDSFGSDAGCTLCADVYYRAICDYFSVTPSAFTAAEDTASV